MQDKAGNFRRTYADLFQTVTKSAAKLEHHKPELTKQKTKKYQNLTD